MKRIPAWLSWTLIGAFLVLAFLMSGLEPGNQPPVAEISYTQLRKLIEEGSVASMTLKGEEARAHLKKALPLGQKGTEVEDVATLLPSIGDPSLIPTVEAKGVELTSLPADDGGARRFLYAIAPWLVLIAVYWFFWNRMYRNMAGGLGGRDVTDFLHGSAKREVKDAPQVTFADVAGQDNAKREVAELVDFLKSPEQYRKLGAEPPRGVLMVGPPGTGKTLLARALAGEAGVPFFYISASEFIEVFVGVGASRVRKMFEEAKKRAPSIIFIDELDSIGRVRGTGLGGGHDEREQTLNQILAEMDGFQGHEAVIVLAATNRPDVLDPALLRPGRFDRHVTLELPDKPAREAILKVHVRKVPLASDVDVSIIASSTPGFSGADLKNLVNEAAMMAAREGETQVAMRHFDEMRDKVMMGSVRTLAIQPEEHHRLAVHESGHTVVAHFLPHADPLYKVTIIPRGRALGATQSLPEEERHTLPEEYLRDRIAVMLGGRTAERELLGSVSTGADDDIRQATALARAMVARWGMSSEIGPMDVRESEEHPFLGREIAQPRHFSDTTAYMVDEAVRRLLLEAEERAAAVIREHKPGLMRLIAALEAHETLGRGEIDACLGPGEARVGDARADPKRGPRAA
ncbi:MAG TPA: ATP-dependent zinc metalloprotease FtsH [Alphaproteobacteria bacterium]|nr:ATP-dependent zinc metalloprotease FtsH [Alphaproteobacteria bacterium]